VSEKTKELDKLGGAVSLVNSSLSLGQCRTTCSHAKGWLRRQEPAASEARRLPEDEIAVAGGTVSVRFAAVSAYLQLQPNQPACSLATIYISADS